MPNRYTIKPNPKYADRVKRAEEIIGYEFDNSALLEAALTHPSAAQQTSHTFNYERLEFLGDSILGAIIASRLFDLFPDLDEGGLTRIKVSLVSGDSLSAAARDAGLADTIIFGDSEIGTQGRGMHSALENVFEAIVAALYLDGGLEPARDWVLKMLERNIDIRLATEPENPKSSLQEYLQARRKAPVYEIIDTQGPPHARVFRAAAKVEGEVLGEGEGRSKKNAEAAAAAAALRALGVD